MVRWISLAGLTMIIASATSATTYVVRPDGTGDFPTIQAAIDAAHSTDVIELADGTFRGAGNRDIDFRGKAITVRSESGDHETCVIDCQGSATDPHRGFYFHSGEGSGARIEGVAVIQGYAPDYPWRNPRGGAVYCDGCNPSFSNCFFAHNVAVDCGGAVHCDDIDGSVTFWDCTFATNASGYGGAICCRSSPAVRLERCLFSGNMAVYSGGAIHDAEGNISCSFCTFDANWAGNLGGAISCSNGAGYYVNCTVSSNAAPSASAIYHESGSHVWLINTILAFGSSPPAGGYGIDLLRCDVYGNAGGDWVGPIAQFEHINDNLWVNPCFCNRPHGDYHLRNYSPCNRHGDGLIGAWPVGCWDPQGHDLSTKPVTRVLLAPPAPNPFSSSTRIAYEVPAAVGLGNVRLAVYSTDGRLVRTLIDRYSSPGTHAVAWDGRDQAGTPVAGGVFFCRLTAGAETLTRTLVLTR